MLEVPDPHLTPAAPAGVSVSARDRRLAEAGLLLVVVIWAANFVVAKASLEVLGPFTFTLLRYIVAALTLFGLVRWRLGAIRWPGMMGWRLLGLGVLGVGFYQIFWSVGLTHVTAGDSALIIAASPVFTALLAAAFRLDRLSAPKLAGALIAFAGVAIVVAEGSSLSVGSSLVGDLLTLVASVLWATYTVASARMLRDVDALSATAWSLLGGLLFLTPFGVAEMLASPPTAISLGAVVGVVYSGSLAAAISIVLVMHGVSVIGPTRASSTQMLVPFGAVVLGAVFLREPILVGQIAGGLIIVVGLWMTRQRSISLSLPRRRAS
jgi:drug/metabolite transporter (DMT)-like permease